MLVCYLGGDDTCLFQCVVVAVVVVDVAEERLVVDEVAAVELLGQPRAMSISRKYLLSI